jgi:hypothetical protein
VHECSIYPRMQQSSRASRKVNSGPSHVATPEHTTIADCSEITTTMRTSRQCWAENNADTSIHYAHLFGIWNKRPNHCCRCNDLLSRLRGHLAAICVRFRCSAILGFEQWLDPGMTNVEAVSQMLNPYDPRLMRCFPVRARVNHVVNDDEGCSLRVERVQTQIRLF